MKINYVIDDGTAQEINLRTRLRKERDGNLIVECSDSADKWYPVFYMFTSGRYGLSQSAEQVPGLQTDGDGRMVIAD